MSLRPNKPSAVGPVQRDYSRSPTFAVILRITGDRKFRVGVVLVGLLTLVCTQFPLGSAIELGGDEGYELMKAFLRTKGYRLYSQIWNDQPPLFTELLAWLFRVVGPSVLAARIVTVGFAALLCLAFWRVIRVRFGSWTAATACFLLISSPTVLQLCVSAMLELPAFGLGLCSVALLSARRSGSGKAWLIASGAVMGVALQTKLTAALLLPATALEIALAARDRAGSWKGRASYDLRLWGSALVLMFALIYLALGQGSLGPAFASHTSSQPVPGLGSPADYRPNLSLFLNHYECLLAATGGLAAAGFRRKWRPVAFPVCLLITVAAVHTWHRPWWDYYYLHFAIPLAWLGGEGIVAAIRSARTLLARVPRLHPLALAAPVVLIVAVGLGLAVAEARLEGVIKTARTRPAIAASPLLAAMQKYAPQTHWVYSPEVIYPFHAGLPVPPELAVVMLKRYWSGQITTAQIIELCRRYRPEQVLLRKRAIGTPWREFLAGRYILLFQDTEWALYVLSDVVGPMPPPAP